MARLLDKLIGTTEARKTYRDAKETLADVGRRDRDETDAFLAANQTVIDAEQHLPKWRRYPND